MTSLDIRDEATIRNERAKSLRSLHSLGLSVSEECEALLFAEQTIRHAFKDYQVSNRVIGDIVARTSTYCDDYADITGDRSLADTARRIRYDFCFASAADNHEILERIRSLAKELATQALITWLRW